MTNIDLLKFQTKYRVSYNSSETYGVRWFDTTDWVRLTESEFETVVSMIVGFSYDEFYEFSKKHTTGMFDITE